MKLMMVAIVSMMVAGCASTIEKARADCEENGLSAWLGGFNHLH